MKLFTKEVDKQLFAQYPKGSDLDNQMVVAKIFNPYGRGVWYLLNSDPEDPDYIWAIVDLFEPEMGSVSRSELQTIKVPPFGLGLERDIYFTPKPAKEVFEGVLRGERYALGGMTPGRYYIDNSGNELRYVGESQGKLLFNDGEKIVTKTEEDFEDGPKETKLFGFFEKGGQVEIGSEGMYRGGAAKVLKYDDKTKMYAIKYLNEDGEVEGNFVMARKDDFEYGFSNFNPKMAHGGKTNMKRYTVTVYYGGEMENDEVYTNSLEEAKRISRGGEHSEIYDNEKKEFVEIEYSHGGEVESEAKRLADNSNWTNEKLQAEYDSNKRDLQNFNNGFLKPSKVIGGGYKSSAIAKRLAKEYLEKNVATYKKALEIRGVMAKGGEVDTYEVELSAVPNPDYADEDDRGSVNIKKSRKKVSDIEEARRVVRAFIEENDLGGGNWPNGGVYKNGKKIGYISYNGRFWEGESMAKGGSTLRTVKLTLSDKDSYDYTYKQDGSTAAITFGFGKEPFEYEVKKISKSLEPLKEDILDTFTIQGIRQHEYKGGFSEAIKNLDTSILYGYNEYAKGGDIYDDMDEGIEVANKKAGYLFHVLKGSGYKPYNLKEANYDSDASIDISEKTHISVSLDGEIAVVTEEGDGKFRFIDAGTSISSMLQTLKGLDKKYLEKGGYMAKGGKVKFDDKVKSIKASLLKRKKVSPKVQKDYGKTYSPKEAEESAKRIAGALRAKYDLKKKFKKGGKTIAQTPAPKKDRVFGSAKNKPGSAASKKAASKIELNESILKTLSEKAKKYNEKHSSKVSTSTLKAVMRRGMGAYSTSHRPTISGGAPNSRQAWGFARVNKFLLKKGGTKVKAAYVQDDDLL